MTITQDLQRSDCFLQLSVNMDVTNKYLLTLTEQHVLWKIPESSLYHVEVTAAHTVHESRQEVCCQAAAQEEIFNTFFEVTKLSRSYYITGNYQLNGGSFHLYY